MASQNGCEAVVRLLLKYKADINLVFQDGDSVLQGIAVDDHEELI